MLYTSFNPRIKKGLALNKIMRQNLFQKLYTTEGISPGEKVAFVKNGYSLWQNTINNYYPCDVSLPWSNSSSSSFLKNRFSHFASHIDPDLLRQGIFDFEDALSDESPFVLKSGAIVPADNLLSELNDVINAWFESECQNSNLALFPYRTHYYDLDSNSLSQSNKWHYDLEVPRYCFFIMLYLNDSPGFGTGVYPYSSSKAISEEHGYISSPPIYRASSLDKYHAHLNIDEPYMVTPKPGDILAFSPSSCFHKGLIPSTSVDYSRKVLHVSYCIYDKINIEFDCKYDSTDLQSLARVLPIGRSMSPYWS